MNKKIICIFISSFILILLLFSTTSCAKKLESEWRRSYILINYSEENSKYDILNSTKTVIEFSYENQGEGSISSYLYDEKGNLMNSFSQKLNFTYVYDGIDSVEITMKDTNTKKETTITGKFCLKEGKHIFSYKDVEYVQDNEYEYPVILYPQLEGYSVEISKYKRFETLKLPEYEKTDDDGNHYKFKGWSNYRKEPATYTSNDGIYIHGWKEINSNNYSSVQSGVYRLYAIYER